MQRSVARLLPYASRVKHGYRSFQTNLKFQKREDEKQEQTLDTTKLRNIATGAALLPFLTSTGLAESAAAGTAAASSILSPTQVWLLSGCIGFGSVSMGLPGLAAQVAFFSPLEAMKKIKAEETTARLPFLPYSSMFVTGVSWTTYGLLCATPGIWLPNLTAIVMGSYYMYTFNKYCPPDANWLPGTKSMHLVGSAATVAAIGGIATMLPTQTALNILGIGGNLFVISMFGGPLAAIKNVIDTKSTKSIPLAFTCATFVNCSLWLSYGYLVLDDIYVWFPNTLGLGSSIVQLGCFAKYGFHKEE